MNHLNERVSFVLNKCLETLLSENLFVVCVERQPLFPNVSSHEWHSWKADDYSSILSGLVVKLYNRI